MGWGPASTPVHNLVEDRTHDGRQFRILAIIEEASRKYLALVVASQLKQEVVLAALLKSKDIVVHPRCRHLIDELILYSRAVDRLTGHILPRFKDKGSHIVDALRYALEGARKGGSGKIDGASFGPTILD